MEQKQIDEIIKLRESGKSLREIGYAIDVPKSTIAYICHENNAEKIKELIEQREIEKKNLEMLICKSAKNCYNISQIAKSIGKNCNRQYTEMIKSVLEKYNVDTSHFKYFYKQNIEHKQYTPEEIFCENSKYKTSSLKDKLIKLGYKEYKCEICGNTEWNGKIIPLETHHINGNHYDNRIENLQLLCPNCHAQTDNYCVKNSSKYKEKNKKKKEDINVDINLIISLFQEYGSLNDVSKKMHMSPKTIKKQLELNKIPSGSKEFRQYVLENYGEYKKMDSSKSSSYLKEYNKTRRIPVDCYTKEGVFVKHYDYIRQVQEDGFNDAHIPECCQGKLKTCQGYVWKYSK